MAGPPRGHHPGNRVRERHRVSIGSRDAYELSRAEIVLGRDLVNGFREPGPRQVRERAQRLGFLEQAGIQRIPHDVVDEDGEGSRERAHAEERQQREHHGEAAPQAAGEHHG